MDFRFQSDLVTEQNDEDTNKVLDDAGITRYCCRRMFVGHIDLLDEVAPFSVAREEL